MSTICDDLDARLGERVRAERQARGWSSAELAARSGVSRAMIHRVERAESSPTASLLGRLSGALGLTLSALLARAEGVRGDVRRAADQPRWRDPGTGYLRTQVTAGANPNAPIELVRVELPPGATVAFPAASYATIGQAVLVLDGRLEIEEEGVVHVLEAGDAIEYGPPADRAFRNRSDRACTYLVAVTRA